MTNKYLPDHRADELLARDADVGVALTKVAEQIADTVRRIGPRDADADEHYVEMITVDSGLDGSTVVGRVNANKWTSWFIEAGTSDTPTFAPLRHATESVGLTLRDVAG